MPDAGKLHRSGIRQDVIYGWGSGRLGLLWKVEKGGQKIRGGHCNPGALRLVKLGLEGAAVRLAIRLAIRVLMRRSLVVIAASEKIEAGELFETTMIRRGGPEGDQHQGQHCLLQRHDG